MVYCSRCGTYNLDDSIYCSNCGVSLYSSGSRSFLYERKRYEGYHYRRGSGGLGLLIAGFVIVIIGLVLFSGFTLFWTYFWPLVLILIGIWVLIIGIRRNNRFRQALPP